VLKTQICITRPQCVKIKFLILSSHIYLCLHIYHTPSVAKKYFLLISSRFFLGFLLTFIAFVSINVCTKATNYKIPRYTFSIRLSVPVSHRYSLQHILYQTPLPAFHSGAKCNIFVLPTDFCIWFIVLKKPLH